MLGGGYTAVSSEMCFSISLAVHVFVRGLKPVLYDLIVRKITISDRTERIVWFSLAPRQSTLSSYEF